MRRLVRGSRLAVGVIAVAMVAASCGGGDEAGGDPDRNVDAEEVSLTISANAISGGKNAEEADWITDYVIPEFTEMMAADGVDVEVTFEPSGVDDEDFKTRLALDMSTGEGADIVSLDGIWVGEFAEAGYIAPLSDVVGDVADEWEGWEQIPDVVQQNVAFEDQRYGVPAGTDGRVIFYNKELFEQAGLPADWQPTSWEEILEAGRALQSIEGVTPLQLNAGTAMGEATTMQGILPLLAGTGAPIWDDGTWQGATDGMTAALELYEEIYSTGLGDPLLQQEAQGRDQSFQMFADGQMGMLIESDYLWRSVIAPDVGIAPMDNRDEVVGWAKIPAIEPGAGIGGEDFVSMSGGSGRVINPNTEYPQQAWELLAFMNSAEAVQAQLGDEVRVTQRDDINAEVLEADPMLAFIAEEVLPTTTFRPGLAIYPQVSTALQEATAAVVSGTSAEEAAENYESELEGIVGDAGDIAS